MVVVALLLIPFRTRAEDGGSRRIKNVIVTYQENWSFDSLYGLFPGANGISRSSRVSLAQRDRLTGQRYSSQVGQPFDLVSGSFSLTTPPQPINNGAIDTRFLPGFNTLTPYDVVADAGLQVSDSTCAVFPSGRVQSVTVVGARRSSSVTRDHANAGRACVASSPLAQHPTHPRHILHRTSSRESQGSNATISSQNNRRSGLNRRRSQAVTGLFHTQRVSNEKSALLRSTSESSVTRS